MWFDLWLKNRGYDPRKLTRKQGRQLWEEFKKDMTPAVKDCTEFLNDMYKSIEE